MAAELQRHAQAAQRFGLGQFGARLRQRDVRAAAREQLRGSQAASRRSRDGHAFVLDGEVRHRSFNVARLNSAKMIPTITNRVITFGSLHPISSKW